MTQGIITSFRTVGCLAIALAFPWIAAAQTPSLEARVASVSGKAAFVPAAGEPVRSLSRGDLLQLGDRVDTTAGGTAIIAMTDGSMVTIQSGSIIVFQDYKSASSLRELFTIILGRVRVKINHFEGKPNPYRMNSPTASIAVRGTEFLITVKHRGDTQVVVYEGLVEVSFLENPAKRTLLPGGSGLWLIPGFDFQFFTPSGRDIDDKPQAQNNAGQQNNRSGGNNSQAQAQAAPQTGPQTGPQSGGNYQNAPQVQPMRQGAFADHDEASPRSGAGNYNRYLASLAGLGQIPLLLRFNAFPEAYLDSLENPAYATNFHSPEGRVYLLPSLSGVPESAENSSSFAGSGGAPADFAGSAQLAYFRPVKEWTFGGSASFLYIDNATGVDSDGVTSPNATNSTSRYGTGNLVAARRFGNVSVGFEAESLRGTSSLFSSTQLPSDHNQAPVTLTSTLNSTTRQDRFTAGVKYLAGRSEEGVFVRYALIDVGNITLAPSYNGSPTAFNSTNTSGHSLELGSRWRTYLTPKLYFGLEAAWIGLSLRDTAAARQAYINQVDRASRESFGLGLGYIFRKTSSLTADFASGRSSISALNVLPDRYSINTATGNASGNFASLHFAIQREFTRRLYGVASYVNVWQSQKLAYNWTGQERFTPLSDGFFSTSTSSYLNASHYSDIGLGWRFSPRTYLQYVFSTDYGFSSNSHTLLLRYTFGGRTD